MSGEVSAAKAISRQEFMQTTLATQRYLCNRIEKLIIEIQQLQVHHAQLDTVVWDVRRAEAEGLRVTFYESEDQVFYMVDAKGEIGFLRGGQREAEALESPAKSD